MKDKLRDVAIRAGKTFWQTALATLVVAIPEIVELIPKGKEALVPVVISALTGALAAGLSATWNGVIAPLLDKLKKKEVVANIIEELAEVVADGGESSDDEIK